MSRFLPDRFTQALLLTVLLASLFPAEGKAAVVTGWASSAALILLFFLHGARLPLETMVAGLKRPGLHALILCSTFVLFPVLGLGLHALMPGLLPKEMWLGLLFVCMLSSTVQSSIAFTSIAGGNVPAALCAATFSNLAGVFITPALVALLLHRQGSTGGIEEMGRVMAQLLLPFAAGSIARRWIGGWAARNKTLLSLTDRSSILIAVYAAFSTAVAQGVWQLFAPTQLVTLLVIEAVLLAAVMLAMLGASRLLRLPREDEIAVLFCGSKKSLASGVPMAGILFGAQAGMVVVPVMLFHQLQLMVCAVLARRYAERAARRAALAEAEA
ncbi:bile acid:sodium symporter [Acetobacteraceae bacterium H6797]|nr:bile acid:sodium symporter [Acetobacteraceae bacterium H6797]